MEFAYSCQVVASSGLLIDQKLVRDSSTALCFFTCSTNSGQVLVHFCRCFFRPCVLVMLGHNDGDVKLLVIDLYDSLIS